MSAYVSMRILLSTLLYICPRITIYVSSYYYIRVLVLLHTCPRTTTDVSSYPRAPSACCRRSPCRQHTSAYVSIRQHTSAHTCELQALVAVVVLVVDYCLVVHRLDNTADHERDVDGLGTEVVANYRHVRDHHSR
jgi:hypothetical protein